MSTVLCRQRDIQSKCARHPERRLLTHAGRHAGRSTGLHFPPTSLPCALSTKLLLWGTFGRFGRSDLPGVAVEYTHENLPTGVCAVVGLLHQHAHTHVSDARSGVLLCIPRNTDARN